VARNTKHKDAKLGGEVILFHISKESARPQMPSPYVDTPLQFDCETNTIPITKVIHSELALWSELVLWRKSAPAQRPPEDFKFGGWFQFLPHHFFSS